MRVLVLLFLLGPALGATLKVLEADRLELRNEEGEEVYILVGNPVRLERDGERLEAGRVVYNRTQGVLLLLEGVRYLDKEGREIQAESLTLSLGQEAFTALQVRLARGHLLVTGPVCERALGVFMVERGYATPCHACGQDPPDYAFRAEEVLLYPGDRVVARGVTLLVREVPVLTLPVLLLFLSERRPRLEVGRDEGGFYLKTALPYVSGSGLGFTLLNYFQGRGYGFGVDHFGVGEAKERYFFLHTPPETFQYRLEYSLKRPTRRIHALLERDDMKEKLTNLRAEALLERDPFLPEEIARLRLGLDLFLDHDPTTPPPRRTQKLELETALSEIRERTYSISGSLTLGLYAAEANPLNRSARALGPYLWAGRLLLSHTETLSTPLWEGASLRGENRFRGFYYTTRNPNGENERQVDWTTRLSLRQTWGGAFLEASYLRSLQEGESPFRFDALPNRKTHELTLGTGLREGPFSLGAKTGRDLEKGRYLPLELSAQYQDPLGNALLTHRRDLEGQGPLETKASLSLSPRPFSFRAALRFDHPRGLFDPFDLALGYALVGGSLNLIHRHGLNGEGPLESRLNFAYREGEASYSLNLRRAYPQDRTEAQAALGLGPHAFSLSLGLDGSGLRYGLAYRTGQGGSLLLELTGRRGEEWRETHLRFSLSRLEPELTLRVSGNLHLPEDPDPQVYLKDLTFSGGIDLLPPPRAEEEVGLSLSGSLSYLRRPEGERLLLRNFGPTLSLLEGESRLHFSLLLSGERPTLHAKYVLVLDRCCWALRAAYDTEKRAFSLAFLYGGQAASLLLDEAGVHLGGIR
ncbi:MAG: LPS-assembly protein LptD [Thermaceae bacterium]